MLRGIEQREGGPTFVELTPGIVTLLRSINYNVMLRYCAIAYIIAPLLMESTRYILYLVNGRSLLEKLLSIIVIYAQL